MIKTDSNKVILVDEKDFKIGLMDKLEAHEKGLLHRAFSVFVFNSQNELLLQRRAFGKYHSEGLWTNTCCSHPIDGETLIEAGQRRLMEEMGIDCELTESFSFTYRALLDNGLTEYELDHVLIGHSDETPHLNTNEVMSFKWLSLEKIKKEIELHPKLYTEWFKIILEDYYETLLAIHFNESL